MCLILFAFEAHPHYRLILAANRDEFYRRPTDPLHFWQDEPAILAGRDLEAGGTWLGITRAGRWAAVTNYRDPRRIIFDPLSRGDLVRNYLSGQESPEHYLRRLQDRAAHYNGFSLLVGDGSTLFYYCSQGNGIQRLTPGLYGMSNRLLDTPWPKILQGKRRLKAILADHKLIESADLLPVLTDRTIAEDHHLPDTGIGIEKERMLSPAFITSPDYGTRSSSVLTLTPKGAVHFTEYTWPADGSGIDPVDVQSFQFTIGR
jgi:uncharacterized protein with NRDE domain